MRSSDRAHDCEEQADHPVSPMTRDAVANMWMLFCFGSLYIGTSAFMISFNKYLVHEGRFPFAVTLVLIHCGFSSILALALLLVKPSLFPSLTSPTEKVGIDRDMVGKLTLIAVLFAIQLVCSNTAYLHASMAFLQMMKESNLVLVYGLSWLASMESFNWVKGRVIFLIVIATSLTIHGEVNFSWTGFFIQASGQIFECAKIVLQALLLSSVGKKLDVLSYVVLVMPLCFTVLAFISSMLVYVYPLEHLNMPAWSDIVAWWPYLVANASVAFALNLAIALFIKNSSAVAFLLAGIAKDAVIVLAGFAILHEPISLLQGFAFAAQLALILIWSMIKFFPERFENGVLPGLAWLSSTSVTKEKEKSCLSTDSASERSTDYGSSGSSESQKK